VASYYTHIISVKDRNLITRSDPRCCPGTALTLPADAPSRREPLVKLIKINMAGGHEQPRRNQVLTSPGTFANHDLAIAPPGQLAVSRSRSFPR
jgi:hypothetical protein